MTIESVKNNGWLVFESIAGSKLYGLNTAASDTDIRGVFILPKDLYYSMEYTAQVSNETNDIVYYELKRFVELLAKNNPNMLELLVVPGHCVLSRHPLMDAFNPELFLSKLCETTFANYAYTQIKKAYGLEKKILNPVDKERKSVLDFCFVYNKGRVIELKTYIRENVLNENNIGLASVPHMRDAYNLYYSATHRYNGVARGGEANDVCVSNIPKGETPLALMTFNKDGYSVYCKKYREYWEWVEKRNDERYRSTLSHGKNYDAKNMMHVFRLLLMAKEIAATGMIQVERKDREFLLSIKQGQFEYDELVEKAERLKNELPSLYEASSLPGSPDLGKINAVLVQVRKDYYESFATGQNGIDAVKN
jgi:predicted nucleotidyltransferase